MADKYYEIINGERLEITGDRLVAKQAEWKAANDALPAIKLEHLRMARNNKLLESDWVVIKAQEDGTEVSSNWKTYRQELRDITKKYSSIEDDGFTFPDKPTE